MNKICINDKYKAITNLTFIMKLSTITMFNHNTFLNNLFNFQGTETKVIPFLSIPFFSS